MTLIFLKPRRNEHYTFFVEKSSGDYHFEYFDSQKISFSIFSCWGI